MGANTMIEFTYEEAQNMLQTQLEQAEAKIAELSEDLQDLRSSSITVEVNMARLFNQNVKDKKIIAEKAAAADRAITA
jgi:prefoldin subunit 5